VKGENIVHRIYETKSFESHIESDKHGPVTLKFQGQNGEKCQQLSLFLDTCVLMLRVHVKASRCTLHYIHYETINSDAY
jgi:hypothetical protein